MAALRRRSSPRSIGGRPMTQTGFVSFAVRAVRQRHPTDRRGWAPRVANLALTLAAVRFAAPVAAQNPQGGTISGTVVVEGAQRPLAGAQIAVEGQGGVGTT